MEMEQKIETPDGIFLIRPYNDADEQEVRSLWQTAFGKDLNPDIWKWKYHRPFFERRILLCVTNGNQPVVMFSCLPYPALYHGREIRIGHAVDSMSHPLYRGNIRGRNGLFALTTRLFFEQYGREDDLVFIYGFPGERHFRLGNILLNYTRMINPLLYFTWSPDFFNDRLRLFKGSIRSIKGSDGRLDGFAWRMATYYPLAIFRDSRFLSWRYGQHPLLSYDIFTYGPILGKRINGYVVLSLDKTLATIVDMLIPQDNVIFLDFLARVCGHLKSKGISLVRTWLPNNHFLSSALMSSGIIPENEPFGIIPAAVASNFHPHLAYDVAMSELFYTMGDGDLV